MCGILYAKVLSKQVNGKAFQASFNRALEQMSYRGPDDKGVWVHGNDLLGHVRLSIVGLSCQYNQPYGAVGSRYKMIFNGEVYNYQALDGSAKSDTQVLYRLLMDDPKPFTRIRGMFAIGWYDADEDSMTFYRDFFGEKPLYYFKDDEVFIAASTIRSILSILHDMGKTVTLNKESLVADYLLFGFFREPHTVFTEVQMLPAGHRLRIDAEGTLQIDAIDFGIRPANRTALDYALNAFRSTDVEKNILASSGIDSTMLLHLAAKELDDRVHAITYKSPVAAIDESEQAAKNIRSILDRSPLLLTDHHGHAETFTAFVRILEQPSSDGLNLFNLLELLKEEYPDARLIYTGLGGDELFGGYQSFKNWPLINLLVRFPVAAKFLPALQRFVAGKKILGAWNPYVYYFLYRLDYTVYTELIDDPEVLRKSFRHYMQGIEPFLKYLPRNRGAMIGIKAGELFDYMKNQLLRDNDNISMCFSIESRSPLLDPDKVACMPDNRNWMTRLLAEKHGIRFGKKRGFTYVSKKEATQTNYRPLEQLLGKNITHRSRKLDILAKWLANSKHLETHTQNPNHPVLPRL